MLTAQSNIIELRTRNRNSLPQKVTANVSGLNWYRADYELRQLRKVKEVTKRTYKLLMHARTMESFVQYSKELDRWIERERILLRIPLPREQPAKAAQAGNPMIDVAPVRQAEQPQGAETPATLPLAHD